MGGDLGLAFCLGKFKILKEKCGPLRSIKFAMNFHHQAIQTYYRNLDIGEEDKRCFLK